MDGLEFEPAPEGRAEPPRTSHRMASGPPLVRSTSLNGLRSPGLVKPILKKGVSTPGGTQRKKSVSFDDLVTLAKPPDNAPVRSDDDLKSQCWYTYEDMRFFACAEVQRRKSLGIDTMSCITPQNTATQETFWDELASARRWCETLVSAAIRKPFLKPPSRPVPTRDAPEAPARDAPPPPRDGAVPSGVGRDRVQRHFNMPWTAVSGSRETLGDSRVQNMGP
jgi:hypothetical protein